jgi:hypothetical protein
MLYNIHINQLAFSQFEKLDYRHAILFDALHKIFTTFTKIEKLDDWYWLSYTIIQDQLPLFQIGKDQLRNLLKDLAEYQLIDINPNNQVLNKTYFKLGVNAELIFKPMEKIPDTYGKNSTPPMEKIPDNNKQDNNSQKEIKNKKNFNAENYVLSLDLDLDLKNLLVDWLEIRKVKKTATTQKAIDLALKFLNKHDLSTQKQIVEKSILSGWVGLFELPEPFNNKPQPKESPIEREYSKKLEETYRNDRGEELASDRIERENREYQEKLKAMAPEEREKHLKEKQDAKDQLLATISKLKNKSIY